MMNPMAEAQENLTYQNPPPEIAELIDAPPTPVASLSPANDWMLLLGRPNLPDIEEVAQEELRLAGIRINPKTNGSSRSGYYNSISIRTMENDKAKSLQGLPENPRIENISWAPDGQRFAFTITQSNGLELWVANLADYTANRLGDFYVNDAMSGIPYRWFSDGTTLLVKTLPANRGEAPTTSNVPTGPVIQSNKGKSAPVRTYQDLLKNPHDVALFTYYTKSQLLKVDVVKNTSKVFGDPAIIQSMSLSPDGNYALLVAVEKPFSYIVPYSRFPKKIIVSNANGNMVRKVADIPMAENIPKGFGAVRLGPRSFSWRADVPASLYWVEAQDGGDPRKEVEVRDQLFYLSAPFEGEPEESIQFALRYGGMNWGDGELAVAYEWWWKTRRQITSFWQPDKPKVSKQVLFDRSYEDRYSDPGDFETHLNKWGRSVLLKGPNGKSLYLSGQGASPEGNRPFIDQFDIASQETSRLWRSEAPYYEYPLRIIDAEKGLVLSRRESEEEPPNYYLRSLKENKIEAVTNFPNPYESLKGVKKELIRYQRKDGIELTGTLYLPKGYDPQKDGRLPVLMWAYPREYKSANAASQVRRSPYEFLRFSWGSPIFWVKRGYAVFDDFGMPIIGEGEKEPNETFVQQLVSGAQAAVDKLDEMSIADTDRLAVGGHSYGAFMTANLLAHSDIFAAGIARSGAYNRSLTPFGFQSEERTFWETPETYFKMSPFMHADKIKEPMLMIHGQADNNSGTYPMQSERMFAALKGHGATTRLVMLPNESHGYRAHQSVMHMLWEMDTWLETHVKNKQEKPEN